MFLLNNLQKNRLEVLKVQDCSFTENYKEAVNEFRLLSSINHKNVVKAYEFKVANEKCLSFLEFCEQGDLFRIYSNDPSVYAPVQLFFTKLKEISLGFQAVHAAGIVHSDLKLENIVVSKEGTLKLIDFDLSQKLGEKGRIIIGTVAYTDPLLLKGNLTYDWYIDVHALGVLAFELGTTFRSPFEGNNDSETQANIITGNYQIPSSVDVRIAFIIHGLLMENSKRRFRLDELFQIIDVFLESDIDYENFGEHTVSTKSDFPIKNCRSIPNKILNIKHSKNESRTKLEKMPHLRIFKLVEKANKNQTKIRKSRVIKNLIGKLEIRKCRKNSETKGTNLHQKNQVFFPNNKVSKHKFCYPREYFLYSWKMD